MADYPDFERAMRQRREKSLRRASRPIRSASALRALNAENLPPARLQWPQSAKAALFADNDLEIKGASIQLLTEGGKLRQRRVDKLIWRWSRNKRNNDLLVPDYGGFVALLPGPRRSPAGPRSSRLGGASQGVFSRNKKELPLRCFLRSAAQPIAISDQAADVWPTAVEPTAAQGTARHQRMICSYGTIVSSAGDCAGRLNRRQDHLRRLT